jgi:hypothetical protein
LRGRLKGPRRRLQEGDDARRRRRRRARAQGFLPALPSALTVHKKAPRNHQLSTLPTRGQHLTKATQAAATTSSITPTAQARCRPSFLVPLLERCTSLRPGRAPRERPADADAAQVIPRSGPQAQVRLGPGSPDLASSAHAAGERSTLLHHRTNSSQRSSSPCASKLNGWPSWPETGAPLLSDSAARPPPPRHATARPAPLPHAKLRRRHGAYRPRRRQEKPERGQRTADSCRGPPPRDLHELRETPRRRRRPRGLRPAASSAGGAGEGGDLLEALARIACVAPVSPLARATRGCFTIRSQCNKLC